MMFVILDFSYLPLTIYILFIIKIVPAFLFFLKDNTINSAESIHRKILVINNPYIMVL